jgi:glutamyl-tRNA synthetase
MYLQELFGFQKPDYYHIPMLMAPDGRRLSKRDKDLDLGQLRSRVQPQQLLGVLAKAAGIIDVCQPVSAEELAGEFNWNKIRGQEICVTDLELLR